MLTRGQLIRRLTIFASVPALAIGGVALQNAGAVSGNIGSHSIQIDAGTSGAPTSGANLYYASTDPLVSPQTAADSDWVKDTSPNTGIRTVADAVLANGSTTVTALSDEFTTQDVGASIGGTGIPTGTTITSFTDTKTVTISAAATADSAVTGQSVTISDVCLQDSIAICNKVGTTAGSTSGHWNGVRIVDGVDGSDQDIFLKGGKENDVTTWNVGPGTVGSSKYDATQAYLANNGSSLYFGMERRGNNGTTAFDFEFSQNAPSGWSSTSSQAFYVPRRTQGDVLFTFEMSGSGSSGSATPYIFTWQCSGSVTVGCAGSYVQQCPTATTTCASYAGVITSINNAPTPDAPWGNVDSHGNWVSGANLDRFEFAEAAVDLSQVFSGFNACATAPYFTEVRTRSSATPTSDLKDTTRIFPYSFSPGSQPVATKYGANASSVTLRGTSDAGTTKSWQINTVDPSVDGDWSTLTDNSGGADTVEITDVGAVVNGQLKWQDFGSLTGADTVFSATTSADDVTAGKADATGSYTGTLKTVWFRLVASKSVGTTVCSSPSTPKTITQVVAVDP